MPTVPVVPTVPTVPVVPTVPTVHAAYTWAKVELLSGCWLEGGGVRWWGEVFPVGDFRCYTLLSGFTAYITSHTVDCSSPLCCCYATA